MGGKGGKGGGVAQGLGGWLWIMLKCSVSYIAHQVLLLIRLCVWWNAVVFCICQPAAVAVNVGEWPKSPFFRG